MSEQNRNQESDSLIANAKGIWPLIFSVVAIVIYVLVSLVMFFISYKFGRI